MNRELKEGKEVSILGCEDLKVYKKAHQVTLDLYRITEGFPDTEKFGLVTQIRRAAASINANVMEGYHRGSKKDFRRFLYIARGSTGELKYLVLLARDLGYFSQGFSELYSSINEISRMLYAFQKSLGDDT